MADTFATARQRALTRLRGELGRIPTARDEHYVELLASGLAIASNLALEKIPSKVLESNLAFMRLLGIPGKAREHAEFATRLCAPWH